MKPLQITMTHEQRYHDQHLDLDFGRKTALLDTKPLVLTRKEYDLLAWLIQHAGELVTRETLLLRVWGYNNQIRTRTGRAHPPAAKETGRAQWQVHRNHLQCGVPLSTLPCTPARKAAAANACLGRLNKTGHPVPG